MELTYRPRRLRRTPALRAMVREFQLDPTDFIYPLFVHEGASNEPIEAMPGCQRWSLEGLVEEVGRAWDLGIRCVVLFPKVADGLKTEDGAEFFNEGGLIPRAIRRLKQEHPAMAIMTDVALDPYSCDGHDGIVNSEGVVLNDETVAQLCRQAVAQARAGADLLGPSDMMDGRVGAIREALDSAPRPVGNKPIPKDKATYQMDPANGREALTEALLDEQEGGRHLDGQAGPRLPRHHSSSARRIGTADCLVQREWRVRHGEGGGPARLDRRARRGARNAALLQTRRCRPDPHLSRLRCGPMAERALTTDKPTAPRPGGQGRR